MAHFIDTNILLYSISTDPSESEKASKAIEILEAADGALSVQVLQEFYVQATRSTRQDRISHDLASRLIKSWTRFRVQDMTPAILFAALEIRDSHGFSYWDSAILAAAQASGSQTLYSEDLSHGREIDGVRIVNPFRAS